MPKDSYEESIDQARAQMEQGVHRLVERTKQNWFLSGYLLGVATMALAWWIARSN
jgi:hypothetical protein